MVLKCDILRFCESYLGREALRARKNAKYRMQCEERFAKTQNIALERRYLYRKGNGLPHECVFRRIERYSSRYAVDPVKCPVMNVYLSHITALRFWRAWSRLHPLALDAFHKLGKVAPSSLFPGSAYRLTSALRNCAASERDVRRLLLTVRHMPEVLWALRDCDDAIGPKPWHILLSKGDGTRDSALVARHRSSLTYPKGSFVEIAPHVFVCSPELVFAQMAPLVSYGELMALGYELCGCYPRSSREGDAWVRCPLTSPGRLTAYLAKLTGAKGVKFARAVAKQVRAKSGSVMETELAAVAFTSELYGGLGIAPALINEPISLSMRASRIARCSHVVLDFHWPSARFGIEYNGRDSHASAARQDRDSRKRDALAVDGIEIMTMTSSQFNDIDECASLLDGVSRRAGKPRRKRAAKHGEAQRRLRRQLRKFHREHFPLPKRGSA